LRIRYIQASDKTANQTNTAHAVRATNEALSLGTIYRIYDALLAIIILEREVGKSVNIVLTLSVCVVRVIYDRVNRYEGELMNASRVNAGTDS